ncbi:hypothetical protein BDI4_260087 [Burkholderia diffusa]|nr:hypothetical protein BDI4_260087 [Burkholderia diffusa]
MHDDPGVAAVRARPDRVRCALPAHHRFRMRVRSDRRVAQDRARARQHGRIRAVSRGAVSLFRRTRPVARDRLVDRRGNRVPLSARDRTARVADDGQAESLAFHRRARHVSVRRRALRRAVRLSTSPSPSPSPLRGIVPAHGFDEAVNQPVARDRDHSLAYRVDLHEVLRRA